MKKSKFSESQIVRPCVSYFKCDRRRRSQAWALTRPPAFRPAASSVSCSNCLKSMASRLPFGATTALS